MLAMGAMRIPKSIVSCGRYWAILRAVRVVMAIATGFGTIRVTSIRVTSSLSTSTGATGKWILKAQNVGRKAKNQSLQAFNTTVEVLVGRGGGMHKVVTIAAMFERVMTV